MKISKFIKDLFTTSLTQVLVLLLGLVLLRIMASALSKDYYGIFMVIRRIIAIGGGLVTLNLGVGLARYISYKKEEEREFLNAALLTVTSLSFLIIFFFFLFKTSLSKLFFDSTEYSLFVVFLSFYLLSYGLLNIAYAYYRGRQEMNRANTMQSLYYLGPVFFAFILWIILNKQYSNLLVAYYCLFSLWGIIITIFYLNKQKHILSFRKYRSNHTKDLYSYSISRFPSILFLSLTFGIPVFFATRSISLEAAAYLGIAVSVVRLMEIFAAPFNLLFLPKFAEIKRNHNSKEIQDKVSIVVDFLITTLPVFAVVMYGMARYVVIIFFGEKYTASTSSVSIVILFSVFYVSYALLRGILDGLFTYPFVNIICIAGFASTSLISILFHKNIVQLAIAFGIGLFFMGIFPLSILIKKKFLSLKMNTLLISLFVIILVFILSFWMDRWIGNLISHDSIKFAAMTFYRVLLLAFIHFTFWKPKSLWYRSLMARIKL